MAVDSLLNITAVYFFQVLTIKVNNKLKSLLNTLFDLFVTELNFNLDRCRAMDTPIYGYKTESDPSNCCSYYKCDNGVSRADCCGKGRSYNPKTGQCEHDNSCQSPCLYQETMPGECQKITFILFKIGVLAVIKFCDC